MGHHPVRTNGNDQEAKEDAAAKMIMHLVYTYPEKDRSIYFDYHEKFAGVSLPDGFKTNDKKVHSVDNTEAIFDIYTRMFGQKIVVRPLGNYL